MKKYEMNLVQKRLELDGKPLKKPSEEQIKEWIVQEISTGSSLDDLHLVGANNIPSIGEVLDWREKDIDFYIDLKEAEKKRNFILIEKYQSMVLKHIKNPGRESKAATDAMEKLMTHMARLEDSTPARVIINYSRTLPEEIWLKRWED